MSATGSVPARARRHPIAVVTKARRLAEAGWNSRQIAEILGREDGVTVAHSSVHIWTNPSYAESHARARHARNRRVSAQRSGRMTMPNGATPEWRLARMRALRERGLSMHAIATVMNFDFEDGSLTDRQVEYMLSDVEKGRAA